MKKLLIVLTLIGIGCVMTACARNIQTHRMQQAKQEEHLTFLNSPLDGTCEEFAQLLEEKGYRFERELNGKYLLRGNYMRCKDCEITLSPVINTSKEHKDKIYMAMVKMTPSSFCDDKDMHDRYVDLREYLTYEFGRPNGKETFRDEHSLPCQSITEFETADGYIKLGMEHGDAIDLIYIDKLNSRLNNLYINNLKDDDSDDGIMYQPQRAC